MATEMPLKRRQMRLTPELVSSVPAFMPVPDSPSQPVPYLTPAECDAVADRILTQAPPTDEVWVFAYGSLIWNPGCATVEEMIGTVSGWHRSFCLGWATILRGSIDRPGLMLAIDRGGACKGILYRLPPEAVRENLAKLVRREMVGTPSPMVTRWVNVRTQRGTLRALAFAIDRNSELYRGGLAIEEVADALATAVGERGSMAEYLYLTVTHLEERGIHDRHLWRLQELVAERIERGLVGAS